MKERFVIVTLLIAMVAVTQIPISPVNAKDVALKLISGSSCDPTTFEYDGHMVAKGFAVSISADLPLIDGRITQIKSGCAVAGLGDSWYFSSPYYYVEYTPYVKEMSVRVEGYYHYTKDVIALYDNTGTGGSSWDFFSVALEGIGIVFTAYDIYDWLAKIYQQPPDAEWEGAGHWSRAITRQKTEPAWNPPGGADGWTQMVLYSKLVVRIFGVISRKAVPTFSASRLRLKSMFNHGA